MHIICLIDCFLYLKEYKDFLSQILTIIVTTTKQISKFFRNILHPIIVTKQNKLARFFVSN